MQHLINRCNIESNKAFQRLLDKTQVLTPMLGRQEVIKNRLTHSYEVGTSAKIIATSISTNAFNADYNKSVYNVSLLHDIGHPPFGHEGAKIIDKRFKSLGVKEGFSDNNNNLVIIEKNQISISNYELASLIKYPEKLYECQAKYKQYLKQAIHEDVAYFSKFITINITPKRTLACEIMDEADRNTYTCADLTDCYTLGISNGDELQELLLTHKFDDVDIIEFLTTVIKAIKDKNKGLIKRVFANIKLKFNQNYFLGEDLTLQPKNQQLLDFREVLNKISAEKYIFSEHVSKLRAPESDYLNFYIDYVLQNQYYPSKSYSKKIDNTSNQQQKLIYIRDMIAETTDSFVREFYLEKNRK